MPFVNFCNVRDPRARPPIRQTSPHLRWQATARRAAPPLQAVLAGVLQPQGSARLPKDPRRPPRRPRAEVDIPQPARSGHPLSLADTLHRLEKAMNSNRTEPGFSSRRANQSDPPSRSPMRLRAVSHRHSRKRRCSTAPRGAFHLQPRSLRTWGGNRPALVIPLLVRCSRNLCDQLQPDHDVVRALLAQPKQAW